MSLLRDEQHGVSTARVGFWAWSVFTMSIVASVVWFDAKEPSQAVWTLIGGIIMALITWAAGPRIAQYIGPQIGNVARAISTARDKREPSKFDDHRQD